MEVVLKETSPQFSVDIEGSAELEKNLRRFTNNPVSIGDILEAMGYQVQRVNQPGIDDQITECEVIESTLHGNK